MAKSIPVEMKAGAISKQDYEKRKQIEDAFKGNNGLERKAPASLSKAGQLIYMEILDNIPLEMFNRTDSYVIEVVADAIDQMRECREVIREDGLIVEYTNSAGQTNKDQNKAILIYQKYAEILKKYLGEIGLSPSARSKIANMALQPQTDNKNPLATLFGGDGN